MTDVPVSDVADDREYDIDENDVLWYDTQEVRSEPDDPFAKRADEIKALDGVERGFKRKITNMEKRYEGQGGAESKKEEEHYVTGYNAFNVVAPPVNLAMYASLYTASCPSHYAAINAKVSNIAGLGYEFVETRKAKRMADELNDNEKKREKFQKRQREAKDFLEEMIDGLNEEDTFSETLAKVWKDYEATGNGYIEIGRTNTGKIGYIGHIPSTTIRIRRDRDGFMQIIGDKAVFFRNFGKGDPNPLGNDANPNELIHLKKYAPGSGYYGVPDIVAAQQAVAGNEFVARFNLDYFENKAVPRHVIVLKGATINPKLAKNILEFFETGLKGQNHRSLFVPLPAETKDRKVSLEFQAVEAGVQEASFDKYRKANTFEILMAHGVPISKVGMAEGVALAVARDADKTFKEQVCRPQQAMLEKKLGKIFKEFTDMFYLKLNEMTLTDEETQSKIDERRIKTGQRKPNELRTRDGLPAADGGDEIVDLNAASKIAEQRNEMQAAGNRERDAERSASATDSAGEGRNPKGEGRTSGE